MSTTSTATTAATRSTHTKVSGIDIHTYLVKDAKRAIDFYEHILGLPVTWRSEQGAEFALPDGSTFGVWKLDDGSWHPSGGVFFAVPDIKEARDYFQGRGVEFLEEEITDTGVCHMIACRDSEGNSFMLHQRK